MTVVGLDVGGTKIVGARFGPEGPVGRIEVPTPCADGRRDPGSAAARGLLQRLVGEATDGVPAVGIAICEYVRDGTVTSREVIDWEGQPRDWLSGSHPAVRVWVESDVRCGAITEIARGTLRDKGVGYYVSWGTGLSGCLAVGGAPVAGRRGRAIALGELPAPEGPTLESYASGAGLARRYAARSGRPVREAREVLAAASSGDPVATEVATSAGRALAEALRWVVRLLDPDVVVLGGGLGTSDHPAAAALREAWADAPEQPPLLTASSGPDASLVGAAIHAGWRPS
ncbi:putative ROK family protein [Nostocoides japonicum T1-X7]|uniref:Putative ROK family protein n=1 Tax=Nostocoides japonicum T1-X7 TaxID=1194083 RepID=A0A077LU19_9MICO|nr:ROK family protein [Tetrasphaera japonica]CCH76047.1 putative ROK family protein [Tetrasphaera japonica T1-X7]